MNEAELQEKIKNMSPQELLEFQKQNCVFCQIIAGKIDSKKAYEDDKCIAIFDINPAQPGHTLLLPKEHYMLSAQVPPETLKHLAKIIKNISHCALNTLKTPSTSVFIANGPAAGQMSQHFMMHLIPTTKQIFNLPKHSASDLEKIATPLREYINKKLGINTTSPNQLPPEPIKEVEPEKPIVKPTKEKGYLYFVDAQGDISRAKMVKGRKKQKQKKEKVLKVGVKREPGLLYYVDKNFEIKSAKMNRKGKSAKRKKGVKKSIKKKAKNTKKKSSKKVSSSKKTVKKQSKEKVTKEKALPKKESSKVSLDDISRLFT